MKEKVFKYSVLSLILINFWSIYVFFDFYFEKGGMFYGLGLLFNFMTSVLYAAGFNCLLIIIRLFFYLRKKTNPLKTNFFYILGGIFNINIFIIWLICIVLGVLQIDDGLIESVIIGSFLISCFIVIDIYRSVFSNKREIA